MQIKICLDAGHYGKYNRSSVVPEFYESEFNWKFHLLLKKYLESYGIAVTLTRSDKDADMDLYDRGRCAKGHDLFLSVHANWAARETADYAVSYVPINGSGDALGLKLAKCVGKIMETKEAAFIDSKKSTKGEWDWYGVIYGAVSVGVPGIILEHSFYSNERSAKWLMDDENLDKMAKAEAELIAQHYGAQKPVQQEHYRVISGAYTVRENADAKLERVRKIYPDAIMVSAGGYYKIQIAAYATSAAAVVKLTEVKANGLDGYISTDREVAVVVGREETAVPLYTQRQFVMDVQAAIGAAVDGIAGAETLGKTPTLSSSQNVRHAAVKPVQRWLKELGYTEVGTVDGVAGAKFDAAVKRFQKDNDCVSDGEITASNKTWRVLLGMQ